MCCAGCRQLYKFARGVRQGLNVLTVLLAAKQLCAVEIQGVPVVEGFPSCPGLAVVVCDHEQEFSVSRQRGRLICVRVDEKCYPRDIRLRYVLLPKVHWDAPAWRPGCALTDHFKAPARFPKFRREPHQAQFH